MTAQPPITDRRIEDINPATGESFFDIAETDLSQMAQLVANARSAQQIWAALSFAERAARIKKMRDHLVANADVAAKVVSQSNGKTLVDALATEVMPCALACDWYSNNAAKVLKPKMRGGGSLLFLNKRSQILHVPIGVVGIISPWNYPLSIPFGEIIMGLMAGNAVMLKVAAATPAVGKLIEDIIAAGDLPKGLFTHVVGSGAKVATAFFEHGIGKLFFTGSVNAGKQLMEQAAKTLTPLSLELGGNDAMIVLADADLERATNGAIWGGFQNAGQSCGGVERIYVEAAIYDEFVRLLSDKTHALRHGAGCNGFNVDIGSITTAGQLRTVTQHMEDALQKGARIAAQSQPVGEQSGLFHPATVLVDVTEEMLTMRDETFGPVVAVAKVADAEEAIRRANDSNLALTSSIWTRDIRRGRQLAARVEAGVTAINDHLYTHGLSETPWGGWKESGLGRTHGVEGLHEMTHVKVVNWDLLPAKRNLWWHPHDQATYQALINALAFVFPRSLSSWLSASMKLTPYLIKKMFTAWKTD